MLELIAYVTKELSDVAQANFIRIKNPIHLASVLRVLVNVLILSAYEMLSVRP